MRPPKRSRVHIDNFEACDSSNSRPVSVRQHTDYVCSANGLSSRRSYHAYNTTLVEVPTHEFPAHGDSENAADLNESSGDMVFPSDNSDMLDMLDPTLRTRMRKRTFAGVRSSNSHPTN